jgi:predicted lipoprotein with Yx(FWY)xxD motif
MRYMLLVALILTSGIPGPAVAQASQTASSNDPSHPAEVAFVDEGHLGSVYRQTDSSLRLYTYDGDPPGASRCNGGCASAWPPLYAPANAAPVGDWTVVLRSDRKQQWAYRGKPVYTRFHDSPDLATGAGIPEWHLMAHIPTPPVP